MNPLRWIFELVDRVSGPAKNVSRALKATRGGMDEVREGLQPVEANMKDAKSSGDGVVKTFIRLGAALALVGKAALVLGGVGFFKELPKLRAAFRGGGFKALLSESGSALGRMGENFLDRIGITKKGLSRVLKIGAGIGLAVGAAYLLSRALSAVFSVVSRIVSAVGELVERFGRAVLEARVFRERATFGLSLLTGSAGGAQAVLDQARELSMFLGTDLRDTIGGIQELMSKGFSARGAGTIFQALADLQTISAEPIDTNRVVLAISQIRQAGVLQGDELRQLQESGLPLEHVWERIAAQMGVSVQQVKNMRGQIPAATAIQGILQGISDTTGRPIGAAAREFSMTLPGLLERLKNAPSQIFDAIASRGDGAFGHLRDILADVVGLLDPRSAGFQRFIEVAAAGVDTLVEALRTAWDIGKVFFQAFADGLGGGEGQDAMATFRAWLIDLRNNRDVIDTIRGLGRALGFVTNAAVALLGVAGPIARVLKGMFTGLLDMFLPIASGFGTVGNAIAQAFSSDAIFSAVQSLRSVIAQAPQWGRDLVQGFINGITSMLEPLRTAANMLANAVPNSVAQVLDMHSPSRVMQRLGMMTGEGFARGVDASMPTVAPAVIAPPGVGGAGGAGARAGGLQIGSLIGQLTIGSGSAEELREATDAIVVPRLEAAFEQLAAEYGLA